ncbi:MAG: nucleoside 2-deoxyribosyltransferase [Campylobacterales bacterium]|nr:nucleoside 2-deoxyribosyltransferase [Campylobacterales bacterium]
MKKIYLAGPDVFLPNAIEHGEHLKKLCKEAGFEGLFPLDNIITGDTKAQIAQKIREANKKMIEQCDIVIANVSPFRGPEPDSGTVWEVGFAQGLGKDVYCYSTDLRTLKEKAIDMLDLDEGSERDNEAMLIENFELSHNLMFADRVVANSFEECLKQIKN